MSQEDLVNSRVDIAPGKKNPNDILLWNGSDDFGQKYYDDYLGAGVPWWHIQDSSVAMSIFKGKYDMHGGATDLVYPHHESVMAQLRVLTSNQQPVKIWNHVGLVSINGKKMSKSFGNIIRIRDLIRKYNSNIYGFISFRSTTDSLSCSHSLNLINSIRLTKQSQVHFGGTLIIQVLHHSRG